jgi:hypothetical protein
MSKKNKATKTTNKLVKGKKGEGVKLKPEDIVDLERRPKRPLNALTIPLRAVESYRGKYHELSKLSDMKAYITQGIMPEKKTIIIK